MLLIECGAAVVAIILAFVCPTLGSRWFEQFERGFTKLAHRRVLAVLLVGLTALTLRAALLPILPIPAPTIDDEFSYLLAADTFSHGRLTNPTHPMWVHFETLQVIHQPTYASKYPPAQGLVLAAGQVIAGHPFWGVWFSIGLMSAAICWALQAWLAEYWALLGGFLVVLHLAVFSYWANSYWGGAVAATGGALVLGALPRIKQSRRVRDALLMGLGLAILANSRPYEGLVFSIPVGVALLAWVVSADRPVRWQVTSRVIVPIIAVLALTAGAMGYYFWRVTGNPVRMPYQVFQTAYDPAPYFLWGSPNPLPTYHHETMRDWEVKIQLAQFFSMRTPSGFFVQETSRLAMFWLFYLGPLLMLPLILSIVTSPAGLSWKDISPRTRFLLTASAVCLAGMALEVQIFPHYWAPAAALLFALILTAMQSLRVWEWRGKPVGMFLARSIVPLAVALFLVRVAAAPLHVQTGGPWTPWFSPTTAFIGRTHILNELEQYPGRHLILVRYGAGHIGGRQRPRADEWIYNGADIDGSRVVWARDMGAEENQELIQYYPDRHVWLVEPDVALSKLSPYSCNPAVDAQEHCN